MRKCETAECLNLVEHGKCSTCQEMTIQSLSRTNAELTDQLKRLREDLAEKQALFDLQHKRTLKAQRAWQEATGNTHWPDLGKLIEWLMEQANINTNKIEPEKPQIRCFEIDWNYPPGKTNCPVITNCEGNEFEARAGVRIDGYRIVRFTSNQDDPLYDLESCHFDPLSMKLIKHTHAVGVLDEE